MTRKKKYGIGIALVVLLLIIVGVARGGQKQANLQTDTVKRQDLKRTVLATGTVTSSVDLSLSFKTPGIVQKIPVKVGQKVKEGDVLVQLDSRDQAASVAQARASVASAQANLSKVLSGATSEEVDVAQKGVDSAQVALNNARKSLEDTKKQQATAVANAYSALLNSTLAAVPAANNLGTAAITVSGTYTGPSTGSYMIKAYTGGEGGPLTFSGIESGNVIIKSSTPVQLGKYGLFVQFTSSSIYGGDSWTIDIPNTRATTYVTNQSVYNASLESQRSIVSTAENVVATAQTAYDQAVANLNLKKAQARPADVDAARAQVLSAQAQLSSALNGFENTIIRAPSSGTVTKIDVKVGEQATALKSIVSLQDVGNLYVEANISEANIAQVVNGQPVSYTFDALGADRTFTGTVTTVDPASTVISGVVNYKVTASVDQVSEVKPGMTANMSVLVGKQPASLSVPQRALVERDNQKFVRVITDAKKQVYTETEVTTGLEADGGLIEIKSGLSEGQTIVTFVEEKK